MTPINKGDEGEIRRLVEQEVLKMIKPLETELNRLGNLLVRLFNTNGGPPGFLQTARAEDKEKIDALLEGQERIVERMDGVEDYVEKQKIVRADREQVDEAREKKLKDALEKADRKLNTRIAFAGVVIAVLALLVGWLTYRDSQRKLSDIHQPVVSSMQHLPEHSAVE